jgi:hypothetical protein
MSTFVWIGVGWLILAVFAWSWLAAAHRADRPRREQPPAARPVKQRARARH